MNRIKVVIVALAVTMFSAIGLTPAQAGECTLWLCGEVRVSSYSESSIRVTYSWGDVYATDRWVPPGYSSKTWGKDTDGFRVESYTDVQCIYNNRYIVKYTTTGWVKIQDDQQPTCRVYYT